MELLQGPVIKSMAKMMEEEHKGKVTLFKKTFQDFSWHVLDGPEEDPRDSTTFLLSLV